MDDFHTERRTARQQEMQQKMEERLSQLVTDGKISEEQKQKILAKHQEIQSKRQTEMESLKNLSAEERQTKMAAKMTEMEAQRQELEQWAKDNGIDIQYLMGLGGMHKGGRGMGGPGMMEEK